MAFIPEARLVCFRTARMVSDSHCGLCQIVRLLLLRDADGVCSERQRRRRVTTLTFICTPVQKHTTRWCLLELSSNSAFASSQCVNLGPFYVPIVVVLILEHAIHSIGVVALRSIGAKGRFC